MVLMGPGDGDQAVEGEVVVVCWVRKGKKQASASGEVEGDSGSRVRGSKCGGRAVESRLQFGRQRRTRPVGGLLHGQLVGHRFSEELVLFEWQPVMNGDSNEQ
jgi:hypothetical protein